MEKKKAFSVTDLYLLFAVIIWGSDYLFAKIALRELSPMNFAAMRTVVSAAILLPLFIKRENKWTVSVQHFLWLVVLAFLGTFANRVCWSAGLKLTTASNSALLMATSPIFVLVTSYLFLRREVTLRSVLGIFLSFVGVLFVIHGDLKGWAMSLETLQGDLIVMLAAAFWALFTVLSKGLPKDYSSFKITTYTMLIGATLFLPFLPNEKAGGWLGISGIAWFSVIYVAILGNCLAYFLCIRGIQNIGALRTMLYYYLTPVTAILLVISFLEETLTALQVLGTFVVFGGIFLARYEKRIK